jgi:hypothetical protein
MENQQKDKGIGITGNTEKDKSTKDKNNNTTGNRESRNTRQQGQIKTRD